jgi:hypothetical protein
MSGSLEKRFPTDFAHAHDRRNQQIPEQILGRRRFPVAEWLNRQVKCQRSSAPDQNTRDRHSTARDPNSPIFNLILRMFDPPCFRASLSAVSITLRTIEASCMACHFADSFQQGLNQDQFAHSCMINPTTGSSAASSAGLSRSVKGSISPTSAPITTISGVSRPAKAAFIAASRWLTPSWC